MSKSNALLTALDDAFDVAERKATALGAAQSAANAAISEQQRALEAVKAEHAAVIETAEIEYRDAQVALERLREQLNERIGTLTAANPRVTVR